jgi:hypothetical protein
MKIGVHVSIMSNMTLPVLPPLMSPLHDFLAPPPALTPTPTAPSLEAAVPVMWPPGLALQQNKLTTTVLHKFQFIMLEGHDCGYMIPHVTIPPTNLMLPIIMAFSSRKVLFSASTVKANGTAIGCSQLLLMPLPMMTCASPISRPTSAPPLNVINNVEVGMTVGDLLAGAIAIALSVLADHICNALSKKKDARFENFFNMLSTGLAEILLGKAAPLVTPFLKVLGGLTGKLLGASNIGPFLVKTAAGALAGGAKILLTGDGSIKVGVGSGYAGGSVTYAQTRDGKAQYTAQVQGGTPVLSGSASAQHTTNPDGTTSNQTAHTEATPLGQHQSKSKTDYDASGHEKKTTDTDVTAGGVTTAPEVGGVAVHQSKTTTAPGKAPERSSSTVAGGGSPIGSTQFWGSPL